MFIPLIKIFHSIESRQFQSDKYSNWREGNEISIVVSVKNEEKKLDLMK